VSKTKAWESRDSEKPERATATEALECLRRVYDYRKIIAGIREGGTEEQFKKRVTALLESLSTGFEIDPMDIRTKFLEDDKTNIVKLEKDMEACLPTSEDVTRAKEDLELVTEIFESKLNRGDYEDHLLTVIHQGFAFEKNAGLAASLCAAADRIRRDRIKEAVKKAELNEWFGTEGKREVFILRCVYTQSIDGAWGSSTLHIFLDKEGRKAKWFSSSESLEKAAYEIKATVKKHETYEGRKVTQLMRCKIVRKLGEEAMQCPF
jgi:hypothetical protein